MNPETIQCIRELFQMAIDAAADDAEAVTLKSMLTDFEASIA